MRVQQYYRFDYRRRPNQRQNEAVERVRNNNCPFDRKKENIKKLQQQTRFYTQQ